MIEDTLEEDLPQEFKGGTLTINPEDKTNCDKVLTTESPDKADNKTNKIDWGSNLITIPNKISCSLWSKNQKPSKDLLQTVCVTENPNNFFTFRESVLARALNECKEQFLDEEADGPLIDAFLLTQINHWNSDKERLVLLTRQTLVICKYDFIALKRLAYKKLPLDVIEEIIHGELVYPSGSLVPQVNGIVDGVSSLLETYLLTKLSKSESKEIQFYRPSNRNMKGVRLVWNKNKPQSLGSYWNPFNDDVPFCTFTFHPLFFHKDGVDEELKKMYCLDSFIEKLSKAVADLSTKENLEPCIIQEKDIVLQTYIGIGSVIHNRNSLGFFKVRGKFSF